jgi:hypothetical protein
LIELASCLGDRANGVEVKGEGLVAREAQCFRWAFALTTANGDRRGRPYACPMPYISAASLPSETVAKRDGRSGERVLWGEAERAQVALRVGPHCRWFRWAFALTTANGNSRGRSCTCSMLYMSAFSPPSESGRLFLEGGCRRRSRPRRARALARLFPLRSAATTANDPGWLGRTCGWKVWCVSCGHVK